MVKYANKALTPKSIPSQTQSSTLSIEKTVAAIAQTQSTVSNETNTTASNSTIASEEPKSYGVTLSNLKSLKSNAKEILKAQSNKGSIIDITHENLKVSWLEVVDVIASAKAVYKSATLESELEFNGSDILIKASVVAYDFLKNERLQLLGFFKKYYSNDEINVLFAIKEEKIDAQAPKVLSTKEVFEKMALKNPALGNLKESLGLDFDY